MINMQLSEDPNSAGWFKKEFLQIEFKKCNMEESKTSFSLNSWDLMGDRFEIWVGTNYTV